MKHHRPILMLCSAALIVCLLIIAIVVISWKALVLNFAENELRAVFKGSSVKIGSRDIVPGALLFRDIGIATKGRQFLKIREFRITFTVRSLIRDHAVVFFIEEAVVYDKLKIAEVRGSAISAKGALSLSSVSVVALNGIAEGDAMIKFGKTPSYSAALKLRDIQLQKVIEVFELSEKIDVSGSVGGSFRFSGEGPLLTHLKGKLKASPEGGLLTIKNKEWLDAIARYAKQDVSVIVENFKNYRYNEGTAVFGLKGSSIFMDAHLNGDAGRRDLMMLLHDFNKKGG